MSRFSAAMQHFRPTRRQPALMGQRIYYMAVAHNPPESHLMRRDKAASVLFALLLLSAVAGSQTAASQPRARDLGIPFDGTPGPLNAITDVAGVEVGYKTLISGEGRLVVG